MTELIRTTLRMREYVLIVRVTYLQKVRAATVPRKCWVTRSRSSKYFYNGHMTCRMLIGFWKPRTERIWDTLGKNGGQFGMACSAEEEKRLIETPRVRHN